MQSFLILNGLSRKIKKLLVDRDFRFYGLLVLIVYFVIYMPLFLTGKMYIYLDIGADTYAAYWPTYAFIRDYFQTARFYSWSYQIGLGSNVFILSPWPFDPYNIFIIIFDKSNIDIGIFIAAAAKTFSLALLAYFYIRRLGYRGVSLIAASVAYTFCGFFVGWGTHYHFATAFVLFTLVMLNVEGWLASPRKWLSFVLSIALLAMYWPYMLFMVLIFLPVYFVYRYLKLFSFHWQDFLWKSFFTGGLIFLGMALSAIVFFPQAYVILHSPRVSGHLFPTIAFASVLEYYTILMRFFSNGLLGVNNYSGYLNYYESPFLYTGILIFFLTPRLFFNDLRRKSYVMLLVICVFLLVFPNFVNPFFGAFSKYAYRWTFVLVPIFTITLAEALSVIENNLYRWVYVIIMLAGLVIAAAAIVLGRPEALKIMTMNLRLSAISVMIASVLYGISLYTFNKKVTPYLLLVILTIEIAVNGFATVNLRGTVPISDKSQTPYFDSSTNEALDKIAMMDSGFYRINKLYDQVYLTDSLFQGFNGEKQYSSIIPGYIWDLQNLFDLRGSKTKIYLLGFSDKQSLRDVSNVKYMLSRQEQSFPGYDFIAKAKDVYIYRNNNAIPLGFVYKNYISVESFKKLDLSERQYVIYDAAIVPDELVNSLNGMNEIRTPSLKDLEQITLESGISQDGLEITEDNFPRHIAFNSTGSDPKLEIKFSQTSDTTVSIKFSARSSVDSIGRVYYMTGDGTYNEINSISFDLWKGFNSYNITIPSTGVKAVRLDIAEKTGTFAIDDFSVVRRDDQGIAAQAALLASSSIDLNNFSNDYVRATVDLNRSGLVYFSIPFDPGWNIYVDGELAPKIKANIAFMGVFVQPGRHTIELKYTTPWLREGAMVTIITVVVLMVYAIFQAFDLKNLSPNLD
jgi:uncharacterized membrane protein YfhO